ncbi:hypothetical protein [Embleya sp. NPDC020630]|uniref:hypothetical protein n=1 Tax=Embleya sp. NPDC020630 TaxID=3363979 RepID=UPI0037976D96
MAEHIEDREHDERGGGGGVGGRAHRGRGRRRAVDRGPGPDDDEVFASSGRAGRTGARGDDPNRWAVFQK